MPQMNKVSPVARRELGHRTRNTIWRQLDVIQRCAALSQTDIDDETFPVMLGEIVSDLGVGKDAVADALDVNLATLYRWLQRKSLPLACARPILLGKLTPFLREDIDRSVERLVDARSCDVINAQFGLSDEGVQFLAAGASSGLGVDDDAILKPLEGPYGDIAQGKKRPTFAAFAWSGAGTFELMPDAAIAQVHLCVTTPGLSYFCHTSEQFIPINVTDGTGQLLSFIAENADSPALPQIILRTSTQATAFGTLVATSSQGVPYDILRSKRGDRACIHPLKTGPNYLRPQVRQLAITIPRNAEGIPGLNNLVLFEPSGASRYDHSRALELNNFKVYHDERLQSIAGSTDPLQSGRPLSRALCNVAPRIVAFDEASERRSRLATHVCKHEGAELIVPLFGAVDAHFIDTESEAFEAGNWGERVEFQLGELVGNDASYEPFVLSDRLTSGVQSPGVLALNPNRIVHGFTGLSHSAGLLVFTVQKLAMHEGWVARSQVDCTSLARKTARL